MAATSLTRNGRRLSRTYRPPAATGLAPRWPLREIMNALFYVLRGGCPWRILPELSPHQTAYGWFVRFRDNGLWESINQHLLMLNREMSRRQASPSIAIIPIAKRSATRGPH
jgi:transposase